MLFNSHIYLFAFLPITVFLYFQIARASSLASRLFLIAASLVYYGYWEAKYIFLLLASILINYSLSLALSSDDAIQNPRHKKHLLSVGVLFNLGLLGYFKYTDFFIANVNALFGTQIAALNIILPLAISFFTFQQIAYLVESYKGQTKEYNFLNYILVVVFFPHLLAGPIVNYSEVIKQFLDKNIGRISYENMCKALFLISIGLFKKVVIADTLSPWVASGFDSASHLNFFEAWATSLSYTFQLYFDFSGYSDIAVGSALFFNIKFPFNFNSPYKAQNIQDFWRRWHISLSHFLKNHIYIPLGGNKSGKIRQYFNLFITFFLGGIWHGAAWTFVAWGALHGIAVVIHRIFSDLNLKMHRYFAQTLTFLFANFAWVFFRAKTWADANKVIRGMCGLDGIVLPVPLAKPLASLQHLGVTFGGWMYHVEGFGGGRIIPFLLVSFGFAMVLKNSRELAENMQTTDLYLYATVGVFCISLLFLSGKSEFLYFNF